MPAEPIPPEMIRADFPPRYEAWILRDEEAGRDLYIPHHDYPGKSIVHFFMSKESAQETFEAILVEEPQKAARLSQVKPVKVVWEDKVREIEGLYAQNRAIGYTTHSPQEVFENFTQPLLEEEPNLHDQES